MCLIWNYDDVINMEVEEWNGKMEIIELYVCMRFVLLGFNPCWFSVMHWLGIRVGQQSSYTLPDLQTHIECDSSLGGKSWKMFLCRD